MAGLLHDVVEDAGVTLGEITDRFGHNIAAIVAACSEDKSLSWEDRKRHTVEMLPTAPLPVKLVTCADKLSNLRDIRREQDALGEKVWSRFHRGRDQQSWYFRSLAQAVRKEAEQGIYPQIFAVLIQEVARVFPEFKDQNEMELLS